ncbi:uncharacterized protein ACLA_086760 [Aspergillus clavatus NRRL 1]|uniref:Uncharacterized protein n=1 Tax=Aspergillus clavatus (strain ATCC 1007 / CBS 513.65 / DSM 816 / NCTC 3887 / NRRL 1 / QM 1276 / 107) TaxID=344612 RepID=A1CUI8_ASPCL|nr:uncharacterized protein ACLA_086760 [Aspergillus clavatus NRRL 1]EAW06975.1 conserved hypothetical protein [Aspergillus clavatus NRRL 1]
MHFLRKKHKSSSPAASLAPHSHSVEQLPVSLLAAPSPRVPPDDPAFYQRFSDVRLPTSSSDQPVDSYSHHQQQQQQQLHHHHHHQNHPDSPQHHSRQSEVPPSYHQSPITRSQSHHSPTLLNSVLAIPASPAAARFDADPSDQSWPSSPAVDRASDHQQQPLAPIAHPTSNKQTPAPKSRRKLFGLHSSSSSSATTGFLERSVSVKGTSSSSSSRQRRYQHQQQLSLETASTTTRESHKQNQSTNYHSSSETVPEGYAVTLHPNPSQHSSQSLLMQQDPASAHHRPPHSPQQPPPSIQRSNTDSSLLEKLYNAPPADPSSRQPLGPPPSVSNLSQTHPQQHSPVSQLQLEPPSSARPPSRQSLGRPSPLPPLPPQSELRSSSANQNGGMASTTPDRSAGQQIQNTNHPGGSHASLQGNQQQNTPEPGRSTPPVGSRGRDDAGDVDVRALLQKHDELQAKYSKVKRYYFEKDAQVQQLQNTVAHQRMAVSRTVLDDNEYANRFARLDGAIKDLAFAIRKDWTSLPSWLAGHVNEDAHTAGTKEMTAIGRAAMSRWLVEEIFERHFHPALEPALSQQLKSIEMNLRQQQIKTYTDEDRENAIARISNWRRTTFDGLTDALQGKAAEEHRAQLIDRLVEKFVASLEMNLHDPAPPGLANGVRMIVENAVGIAEKIPLESRDICIEYFMPGSLVNEAVMKVEVGLPPLTNVKPPPADTPVLRGSAEHDRMLHDHDEGDGLARESGNHPTLQDGAASASGPREQRVRSVLNTLMGKRPAAAVDASHGAKEAKEPVMEEPGSSGRIRFAMFLAAEVRGRGPTNVLVKAPVYLI